MNINIEYLKSFYQIVNSNSVSQAAKALHLTQSALSQQLKSLEKAMGSELLIRSNKGVQLTEAGKIVYKYAETFLSLCEHMINELTILQKSNSYEIQVSSCASIASYSLPCTLYTYKKKYHDIKITVKSTNSDSVIADIKNKTAIVGFIDGFVSNKDIVCTSVAESKLVLVCATNSPFSHLDNIDLQQLKRLPIILTIKACCIRKVFERALEEIGIDPSELNVEMELESIEAIKSSVAAGQGMAVLPYIAVRKELYTDILKAVDINDINLTCQLSMVYMKDENKEKYILDFIDYIKVFGKKSFC